MRCQRCAQVAVISSPSRCKEHFLKEFEGRVKETIRKHRLLKKSDKVLVAASGGKDSTALLFLLQRLGYAVTALAVDEGIAGYRDKNLDELRRFCTRRKINLKTVSFEAAYGETLDTYVKKENHPCTLCGTFRRQLMNRHAKGFDAIATGHNADDESQAVLMNLLRANTELFPRGGPVTTSDATGFVKRVKPLYFCSEKEVLTYALLNGFATAWNECPYAGTAYRNDVREAINTYDLKRPGVKRRILSHYLCVKKGVAARGAGTRPCARCKQPSKDGLCKACRLVMAKN